MGHRLVPFLLRAVAPYGKQLGGVATVDVTSGLGSSAVGRDELAHARVPDAFPAAAMGRLPAKAGVRETWIYREDALWAPSYGLAACVRATLMYLLVSLGRR